MSVFARLLALSTGPVQTEDALTEVVAHLFRRDLRERLHDAPAGATADAGTPVVVEWLRSVGAVPPTQAYTSVRVETQRYHAPLPESSHSGQRSIVDLVVELDRVDGSATDVVFVEAKVSSKEGREQLSRYAEHLRVNPRYASAGHRALVYLTRDADFKTPDDLGAANASVSLSVAQWFGVFEALRSARSTAPIPVRSLYDDTLAFLTHLGMNHKPRLSPSDVLALQRVPDVLRFMDRTLWEGSPAPARRFEQMLGGIGQRASALRSVADHSRYALLRKFDGKAQARFEVLLGYALQTDGFPPLMLEIGAMTGGEGAQSIAQAIRRFGGRATEGVLGDPVWQTRESDDGGWVHARVDVPLEHVLVEHDHDAAIRVVFDQLLEELERSIEDAPDLPWHLAQQASSPGGGPPYDEAV